MSKQRPEHLLKELSQHYQMWTEDNDKRMTRKNGWNDVTDAYYNKLPANWPYSTKVVDPRIRTSLIEKNARLLNSKLRGRLVPREGGDVISAQINNAILDFQWDSATDGGSMMTKMSICDIDTRLYGSKYALIKWKYETDNEGRVIFDGNEMYPLDIRDCGIDPNAANIKNAKWFQHRSWETLEDLEAQVDNKEKPVFKNLDKLRRVVQEKLQSQNKSSRNTDYQSRVRSIRGLTDRMGEDMAFPVVKIVTEYRADRWITFSPEHNVVLRDIKNPYDHGRIPVAQLTYYPIQDDPMGESEVEPVLGLWKGIQASLCGHLDESIMKMRPPLKIIENAARIETIVYGPNKQWIVDRQDAVMEMGSLGESIKYFQTNYQALVSAFNIAMGDMSQGVSSVQPFSSESKTATEIRATLQQQNTRDMKNQNDLAEFIKDIMMMWLSNNKQFLFSDPEKADHVLRIVGKESFNLLKEAGLDQMEVAPEMMEEIAQIIQEMPELSEAEVRNLYEAAQTPAFPVVLNPDEKNPAKLIVKPKLIISDVGDMAEVAIVPQDLDGLYDYIPDVKSMAIGASEEYAQARQQAIQMFTTNPIVIELLAAEGYSPSIKELYRSYFEELGLKDSDRFFIKKDEQQHQAPEQIQQQADTRGAQEMAGVSESSVLNGLQRTSEADIAASLPQPMA